MDWHMWVLVILAWYIVGWLPSRVAKHYYKRAYLSLGPNAWNTTSEVFFALMAILGPGNLAAGLIWRTWPLGDRTIPWGWEW
jgi:hypothetical protein